MNKCCQILVSRSKVIWFVSYYPATQTHAPDRLIYLDHYSGR